MHAARDADSSFKFDGLWGAYMDDRPFSLDLAKAVKHQCRCVDKMYDLGWVKHGLFDDKVNAVVLMHCLRRQQESGILYVYYGCPPRSALRSSL